MRVLVTGATGFIGRHLIPELLGEGHTIVAVARNRERAEEFDWFAKVNFVSCDIYQPIAEPFKTFCEPEALIHLAWSGLPNYGQLFHFEENLPADYRFLKEMVIGGLPQLVVAGTCFEYGMRNGCLDEDMPSAPENPYALAKDTLRKFLRVLQGKQKFSLQWARLFYMYGPGQNPNSLLAQLDRTLANGDPVFNMSGGEQLRDYLPVEEVARKLAMLVPHPECDGIVNICSGQPISVRGLVEQKVAERQATVELNLRYYPYSEYEPFAFWGCNKKFSSIKQGDYE